jgi:hypothetical protein
VTAGPGDLSGDEDVLLDVLGGEVESLGTDDGHDLEIDDQQAQEIRQIVLTTLPQYLLPVEQMAAQLFDNYEDQLKAALLTTVDSVAQATERIGVTDVSVPLDRLRKVVLHLDEQSSRDVDVQQRVLGLIEDVKRVAMGDAPGDGPSEVATTLVEAFQGIEDVPAGVLEKLTAAGLVTLDQLWTADPGEIVAVSGLDAKVVRAVLEALEARHDRPARRPATQASHPVKDRFPQHLNDAIRQQVEAEAEVDQKRAEVLRTRIQLDELRDALAAAQTESAKLSRHLAESREKVASGLARVAELQSKQATLEKRHAAALTAVATGETRLAELRPQRESVGREFDSLANGLASIRERLTTLMRDAEQTEQESSRGWIEHGAPD